MTVRTINIPIIIIIISKYCLDAVATLTEVEYLIGESDGLVTVCVELEARLERDVTVYLSTGTENDTATGI